jgi:precorrin-2 dehydrogenase/sirohydrochlorin ferrochelatase
MTFKLFPVFMNLQERRVLVAGTGDLVLQKVMQLLPTGATITIIDPNIDPPLRELGSRNSDRIHVMKRRVTLAELPGYDLIIAATGDSERNAQITAEARKHKIWANSLDDPTHCDFYTTSTLDRGFLRIAISSEGKYPGLCAALRKFLEEVLPDEHIQGLEKLAELRVKLKKHVQDAAIRADILKSIARNVESQYFGVEREGQII